MTCRSIAFRVMVPLLIGMGRNVRYGTIERPVGISMFFKVSTHDPTVLPPETLMGNVSEQANSSHLRETVDKSKEELTRDLE